MICDKVLTLNVSGVDKVYELAAIVHHVGQSVTTGHYYVDINGSDGWHRYDDEKVSPLSEVDGSRTGYILLYSRREAGGDPAAGAHSIEDNIHVAVNEGESDSGSSNHEEMTKVRRHLAQLRDRIER